MTDNEVQRTLGRMESKLDALGETLTRQDETYRLHVAADDRHFTALEESLSTAKVKLGWFGGAWAVAIVLVTYFLKSH